MSVGAKRRCRPVWAAIILLIAAGSARGQTTTEWTRTVGGTPFWFDPSYWSNGVPTDDNNFNQAFIGTTATSEFNDQVQATIGLEGAVAGRLFIGNDAGAKGTLLVTGAGTLTLRSMWVGRFGTGVLRIEDGGTVQAANTTYIASDAGSSGDATVAGAGSMLTTAQLVVGSGSGATGQLLIRDGGAVSGAASGIYVGTSGGSGEITLASAGSLSGSTLTLGYFGGAGVLNIGSYDLSHATTGGALSVTDVVVDTGAGAINFNQTDNHTFSTIISGAANLVQRGTGTTTLAGTQGYTGTTTITGGRLSVTGSIAASSLTTVNSGGTLAGTGSVGSLLAMDGGIIAPGNSIGMLAAGDTTFGAGGAFQLEVNDAAGTPGANPGWDLLAISGQLLITATESSPFEIDLISLGGGAIANFDPAAPSFFTFLTTTGGIDGFAPEKFTVITGDFVNAFDGNWSVVSDGYNLSLSYVPEPAAYAALAGVLALAFAAYRRQRTGGTKPGVRSSML